MNVFELWCWRRLFFFFFSVFQNVLLEPIIQSEVSQKDTDHYNILTNIYGI